MQYVRLFPRSSLHHIDNSADLNSVFSYLLVSTLSANQSWYITIVLLLNVSPIYSFAECDTETEFTCKDGSCIPIERKCDQENDCGGGEDEQDCGEFEWSFVGER